MRKADETMSMNPGISLSLGGWLTTLAGAIITTIALLLAVLGHPLMILILAAGAVDFAAILWRQRVGTRSVVARNDRPPSVRQR